MIKQPMIVERTHTASWRRRGAKHRIFISKTSCVARKIKYLTGRKLQKYYVIVVDLFLNVVKVFLRDCFVHVAIVHLSPLGDGL